MASFEDICRLFYESEYVPLFLYRNGSPVARFPETELRVEPPSKIREQLLGKKTDAVMGYSDSGCLYFLVRIDERAMVFGGPVPLAEQDHDVFSALCREYLIGGKDIPAFADYIDRIPAYPAVAFGKKVNQLLYLLTGKLQLNVSSEMFVESEEPAFQPESKTTNLLFDAHNREFYNNSFEIESILMRFIAEGDLEGYEQFIQNIPPMNVGKVASTGLRSLKNNMIISIALACRAAIAAGVPRETTYALSDSYILEIERLSKVNDLMLLNASAMRDYITRVRQIKESNASDSSAHSRLIHRCVNYIHRNLNHRITVDEVAEYVHMSRSYLSTTFRQCMGVPLNRYIIDAKLEEGTNLLQYTDRSIASISEYLCFSSQSHFQQSFKEKYGMTPRAYRSQFVVPKEK